MREAQTLVRPSERMVRVDGALQARKMDVQLYTMTGASFWWRPDYIKAKLRTGGGFAPVFAI
jgi:hypothetical protein